jgi:soluble lytic murein transglycosylase-like protein
MNKLRTEAPASTRLTRSSNRLLPGLLALVLVTGALASTSTPSLNSAYLETVPSIEPANQSSAPLAGQPALLDAANAEAQALSAYIASRWKVSERTAARIVRVASEAAETHELDPLLVLAVVARESSFQHNGNAGNLKAGVAAEDVDPRRPHGLMQVAGRFHPEKMPLDELGNMRVTTDEENIHIGSRILSEYLQRERGNLTRALQRYNGNLVEGDTRFATYVLRVRDQLEKAASEDA